MCHPINPHSAPPDTDPECFWLTNYLESLLVQVWHPMTVSTNSRACKRVIMEAFKETGSPQHPLLYPFLVVFVDTPLCVPLWCSAA